MSARQKLTSAIQQVSISTYRIALASQEKQPRQHQTVPETVIRPQQKRRQPAKIEFWTEGVQYWRSAGRAAHGRRQPTQAYPPVMSKPFPRNGLHEEKWGKVCETFLHRRRVGL